MSDEQKYYISGESDDVIPIFTAGLSFRQDVLALASLRIDNRRGRLFRQGSNQMRSVLLLLMQFISTIYD